MVRPILETMYKQRREMVPCFIGDPGIGKTQGLYEFAEDKGVNVVTFILSNTVPSEVSGIRMPDNDTKKMEVFDDMRMASLKDGDILFFDEILEAPPMLWAACLTLIQDRIMASGRKLPDVMIVAASNRVVSPGIIPASTRDRFQFIELEFSWEHWCKWFNRKFGIVPDQALRIRIEGDSDQYNILTPRRITKLYTWMKGAKDDDERDLIRNVISNIFDDVIAKALMSMTSSKPSAKRQIRDAIASIEGVELPEDFELMTFKDILEKLMELEQWPKIEETLGSIELEEEE